MTLVLVTRPADQVTALTDLLARQRIATVAVPTVAIRPPLDLAALDAALRRLDGADWLALTSANGARAVIDRLAALGVRLPASLRVAAVGPATAAVLREGGIRVDFMPARHLTAAIADGLRAVRGRRIILARADSASADLHRALERKGALVEEVVAYRTVEGPPHSREALRAALREPLAGVAFTSGSTVRGLLALLSPTDRSRAMALPAFCIGPVTAAAARRAGFAVPVMAEPHTAAGMAAAIHHHLATRH